jgi:hypothetical protein
MSGRLSFVGRVAGRELALLRELLPSATRIAVLLNPADPARSETVLGRGANRRAQACAANPGAEGQHQTRNRCCFRNARTRAPRRALCRPRCLLQYATRPAPDAAGAPCHSNDASSSAMDESAAKHSCKSPARSLGMGKSVGSISAFTSLTNARGCCRTSSPWVGSNLSECAI